MAFCWPLRRLLQHRRSWQLQLFSQPLRPLNRQWSPPHRFQLSLRRRRSSIPRMRRLSLKFRRLRRWMFFAVPGEPVLVASAVSNRPIAKFPKQTQSMSFLTLASTLLPPNVVKSRQALIQSPSVGIGSALFPRYASTLTSHYSGGFDSI